MEVDDTELLTDVTFSGSCKRKTSLEKCLIFLTIFFFATTIAFLVLFIHFFPSAHKVIEENNKNANTTLTYLSSNKPASNICDTPECINAAQRMLSKMDRTVDPCNDFYKYACGQYLDKTELPAGIVETGTLIEMNKANQLLMKEFLTEDIQPDELVYVKNMKKLYKSCMDEDQIERTGLPSYKSEADFVNDWPTLNPNWNSRNFNISEILIRYAAVGSFPLVQPTVEIDYNDYSRRIVYLGPPKLDLSPGYFSGFLLDDTVLTAYRNYLREFAMELGADSSVADQDAQDIMKLLTTISQLQSTSDPSQLRSQRSKMAVLNNRFLSNYPRRQDTMTLTLEDLLHDYISELSPTTLTVGRLSELYTEIDVNGILKATFAAVNMTLEHSDKVVILDPNYLRDLSMIFRTSSKRTVQNFIAFTYAKKRVGSLTKRMNKIRSEFDKILLGFTEEWPRWVVCVYSVSTIFPMGISKQFVVKHFSEQTKAEIEKMVQNLESAFKTIISQDTWMGKATKKRALNKLEAMIQKVGYPDVGFTDDDINKLYSKYLMLDNNYYANQVLNNKLVWQASLMKLRQSVVRAEWIKSPFEVNAFYRPIGNVLFMNAAILQPPLFSTKFPDSLNYGAIGIAIGHEMTHGFDYIGSQYDETGNLSAWWHEGDYSVFEEKIQCLVSQYSGFFMQNIYKQVNGELTKNENLADNGGLRESFKAYQELMKKKEHIQTLPLLGLTHEQEFFLAFGQLWCEKHNDDVQKLEMGEKHSPAKYRVIGALQNSEDFSEAYNCPSDSYMNPVLKCSVW